MLLFQTMVVAWRRVRKLPEDPEQARMWLFTIARNTLLNHGRGQRRAIAAAERLRSIIGAHNRPHDAVDDAIDVQGALATLEPHVAELVRLIHWEQFTIADAAALLGVSASTARGQYMRARTTLAKLLVDETVAEKNPG